MASEIAERIAERAYSNTTQLSVTERREMEVAVDEELAEVRAVLHSSKIDVHHTHQGSITICENEDCIRIVALLRSLDPAKGAKV